MGRNPVNFRLLKAEAAVLVGKLWEKKEVRYAVIVLVAGIVLYAIYAK